MGQEIHFMAQLNRATNLRIMGFSGIIIGPAVHFEAQVDRAIENKR